MRSASIVAIGTELLFGQIVNTNAAYISEQLHLLGISVLYHFTVGDNPGRLKETLASAAGESDIVITTGGLGPTQDDLTKEVIAELCGVTLLHDGEAHRRLDEIMRSYGRSNYTENNLRQAFFPEGAEVFYNEVGTAPGFVIEKEGKAFIAVPGPPREMVEMMRNSVMPYLAKKSDAVIHSKMLRFYGIGESALETALLPVIDGQTDPTVATYAKEGEVSVRISSMRCAKHEAEAAVEATSVRAKELAGEYLYSDEGKDYPQVVVELLKEKGMKLAAAESCTGGLFAGAITSVPGSSEVFDRGFVTYSNKSKEELLGVSINTLDNHGAVSEACAREMAAGALARSGADIAVAVTGVAGPGGGSEEKPVGTVFFALAARTPHEATHGLARDDVHDITVHTHEKRFRDRGRRINRQLCVLELCDIVRKHFS
ncbi:MAG: competence/damage-inducible protein A [Clostridiales bacterium]|nr:competence/damage-inducible protein A [Clostridiales bacterium]